MCIYYIHTKHRRFWDVLNKHSTTQSLPSHSQINQALRAIPTSILSSSTYQRTHTHIIICPPLHTATKQRVPLHIRRARARWFTQMRNNENTCACCLLRRSALVTRGDARACITYRVKALLSAQLSYSPRWVEVLLFLTYQFFAIVDVLCV